jgi:hypothetical protein
MMLPGATARAQGKGTAVVELFTSQGCSSCPPADALLTELRHMPGVITLAYHVDYWDYLGWKDSFGSAQNSQRQYDYARARGDMDVYTPQVVVNGSQHVVGSDRKSVLGVVAAAQAIPASVTIGIQERGMELEISIGTGAAATESTLWVIGVLPEQTVKVMRGENAGSTIVYSRSVRSALPAGMWSGTAATIKLPKDGVLAEGCKSCVALLQQGKIGPVIGVAQWGDSEA